MSLVLLVGGGPGDAGLLTLRAEAALQGAATVVTDAFLLDMATAAAPRAEVVAVTDGNDAAEDAVNAVRAGRPPVVRLYTGDPWLHPTYAAEAAALAASGVSTEAVPGVSLEVGTATAAGVAIHDRRRSVTATIAGSVNDLPALAGPGRTVLAVLVPGADPPNGFPAAVAPPVTRSGPAVVVSHG